MLNAKGSCQAAAVYVINNAITISMTCGSFARDAAVSDVQMQHKSRWTGLTSNLLHVPVNVASTIEYCMILAEASMRVLRRNLLMHILHSINNNRIQQTWTTLRCAQYRT